MISDFSFNFLNGAKTIGGDGKKETNKTGARQYTRAVLTIFAEIHSTHPISAYIFLLSPTLGLPPRFIDALFGVHITGISGWNL